jgi:putative transposase
MPSPKPKEIKISSEVAKILETIANCTKNSYRLIRRIKIILEASNGINNSTIAQKWDLSRSQVRYWRQKWREHYSLLESAEKENLSAEKIKSIIISILSDKERPGRPNNYTAEQIVQIVSIACEEPSESGRPISHWSRRELRAEALKRGIVENISDRSVGRFLKRSEITTTPLSLLAESE